MIVLDDSIGRNEELVERTKELAQVKKEAARLRDVEAELQKNRLLLTESTDLLERKNDECATLSAFKAKMDVERPQIERSLAAAEENSRQVQGMLETKTADLNSKAKQVESQEQHIKDLEAGEQAE